MPVFLAFVAYLLGSLVLSALLLPLLYPGIEALLGDTAEPSSAMYRIAMLLMLLGFPWFLKRLRLLGWREIGFTLPARAAWVAVFKGLGLGTAMLAGLALVLVLVGARVYAHAGMPPAGELLEALLGGLIGGLLVGLIEEAFFRGMMHTGMRRRLAFWPTALLTGAFYAAVHFIRPAELPAGVELDLAASLSMLIQGLAGLFEFAAIHDSLVSLLVAGVLLAMVRERTGNICWVIGIHAGWVLVIKVTKLLTDVDKADGLSIWLGHYDKVTGWLAAMWLALVAAVYWRRSRPRSGRAGCRERPATDPCRTTA
ncbi:MAG: CPBP family intramembrane glutamic endopeptidase [Halofilum sp. (in: g-proteobacteria)]|nr:CPBP family intramembrane glutamic endopeptidase [Halofilum sp. (in: g-proteobacteria)]